MNTRSPDPLDELAHADPVRSAPPPSESKARVWAHIQEATMDTSPGRTRRGQWVLGVGAVALVAVAAFAVLLNGGPTPTPSQDPGPNIGSCAETYTARTLANRDFAFDGTVIAIEGDSVTFAVTEAFRGDLADSVTLEAAGMTGPSTTSSGGPSLAEGQRYLVAGDDQFVWSCGFTQPYDQAAAAEWSEATR
jgi:hypothetical protein